MTNNHPIGDDPFLSRKLTNEELIDIVSDELPEWEKACDNSGADQVMFHPDAYGNSIRELLLMAVAIKYATVCKGKAIMVIPKE